MRLQNDFQAGKIALIRLKSNDGNRPSMMKKRKKMDECEYCRQKLQANKDILNTV